MTRDQIEAERVAFDSWYREHHKTSRLDRSDDGSYLKMVARFTWAAYLARAELAHERQAAEEKRELEAIGVQFIPLDKKREEFNRLVDELLEEENGE